MKSCKFVNKSGIQFYQLCDKVTGREVNIGDELTDFNNNKITIIDYVEPELGRTNFDYDVCKCLDANGNISEYNISRLNLTFKDKKLDTELNDIRKNLRILIKYGNLALGDSVFKKYNNANEITKLLYNNFGLIAKVVAHQYIENVGYNQVQRLRYSYVLELL